MHERRRRGLDDMAAGAPPERVRRPAAPSEMDRILALQRNVGNAVVARAIAAQRESAAQQGAPDAVQRSAVHAVLRSAGAPLHEPVRAEMESRLNADFSDVRLHTGPEATRSAAEIGARAYTSGNHVVIGDGGADPHTLAHELTHVIQQRTGPVAGTDTGTGLRISDPDDRFEQAAEANARRAMAAVVPAEEEPQAESRPE